MDRISSWAVEELASAVQNMDVAELIRTKKINGKRCLDIYDANTAEVSKRLQVQRWQASAFLQSISALLKRLESSPKNNCSRPSFRESPNGVFGLGPLSPRPRPLRFPDPRIFGREVELLAFYFPGRLEACDRLCRAAFLGNFYEIPGGIDVQEMNFRTAEGAFQALKVHDCAKARFANVSGEEAFLLSRDAAMQKHLDPRFSGHLSSWAAMLFVLQKKFERGELRTKLAQTSDAFLLEHNSSPGRDWVWSDNCDGTGRNWLGLQLMLVRDQVTGKVNEKDSWTMWCEQHVDLKSGQDRLSSASPWQRAVLAATKALTLKLKPWNSRRKAG